MCYYPPVRRNRLSWQLWVVISLRFAVVERSGRIYQFTGTRRTWQGKRVKLSRLISNVATDRVKTSVVIILHIVSTGNIHKTKIGILLFLLKSPFSNGVFCSVSAFFLCLLFCFVLSFFFFFLFLFVYFLLLSTVLFEVLFCFVFFLFVCIFIVTNGEQVILQVWFKVVPAKNVMFF